jgi:hypothetical protein
MQRRGSRDNTTVQEPRLSLMHTSTVPSRLIVLQRNLSLGQIASVRLQWVARWKSPVINGHQRSVEDALHEVLVVSNLAELVSKRYEHCRVDNPPCQSSPAWKQLRAYSKIACQHPLALRTLQDLRRMCCGDRADTQQELGVVQSPFSQIRPVRHDLLGKPVLNNIQG